MGLRYRHCVRVPYGHVDRMGFVYYAHYLLYFEMARSEMLRAAGMPYTGMERAGIWLPVIEAHCDYLAPGRFDDLLTVHLHCAALEGPRLRIEYVVQREDETRIVTGHTRHVCMSPEGRVLRPTPALRELISRTEELQP